MLQVFLLAVPLALIWMMLTQQINLAGFILGYVIGVILVGLAFQRTSRRFNPVTLPKQALALVVYVVVLLWDILLSGIDVVLRIIGVRPVNPGIIRVSLQDKSEVIAALSAHGITITPGQLVVDFDEQEQVVYIHCLDIDFSAPKVDAEQTRRLRYLRRFLA